MVRIFPWQKRLLKLNARSGWTNFPPMPGRSAGHRPIHPLRSNRPQGSGHGYAHPQCMESEWMVALRVSSVVLGLHLANALANAM